MSTPEAKMMLDELRRIMPIDPHPGLRCRDCAHYRVSELMGRDPEFAKCVSPNRIDATGEIITRYAAGARGARYDATGARESKFDCGVEAKWFTRKAPEVKKSPPKQSWLNRVRGWLRTPF